MQVDFGIALTEMAGGDGYINEAGIRKVLEATVDVGASWTRIMVQWDALETAQGVVPSWANLDRAMDLCEEYGVKPLLFISVGPNLFLGLFGIPAPNMPAWASPGTYGNFCKMLAARYGPSGTNQAVAYELWNEMNNIAFFPQAKQPGIFAEYVKSAYTQIKSVHSSSIVITGGTMAVGTGWPSTDPLEFITGMFDAGIKDFCDGIGYHWYNNGPDFTDEPPSATATYWVRLQELQAFLVARGAGNKPIWITEMGVSQPPLDALTARDQLKTMVDLVLSETNLGPFFIYNAVDHQPWTYGILDASYNKKQPLYDYVKSISSTTTDTIDPSPPTGLTAEVMTSDTASLVWNAATDNVGVTSYRVYNYGQKIADTLELVYQATGLVPGTLQSFYVTAVDAAGNEGLPSNTITPMTEAVEGQQEFYEYEFTGSTQPAVFIEVGEGFQVSSGVARHRAPTTEGEKFSAGYYHRDQASGHHSSSVPMAADPQHPDRAAGAMVRYDPATGNCVMALGFSSGANLTADGARIATRIGGVITVRNAKNAPTFADGEEIKLSAQGNVYIMYKVAGGVETELCRWVDQNGVFPGATNRRAGFCWLHKRASAVNYDAPGIKGKWRARDLAPVQPTGSGASGLWTLAIADEEDWDALLADVPWEYAV